MIHVLLLAQETDISMQQWLKSVVSKNKSSKINFANHEAILPHIQRFQVYLFRDHLSQNYPEILHFLADI